MKTITLANHKGGCAKTTVAMNLSVVLASSGFRVLAIDLDPQGNLSAALGADLAELEETHRIAYRLMLDERGDYSSYLFPARPRLDLIPASIDDDAEALIDGASVTRELLLKLKLDAARPAYDFCVIDTPPALRTPTLNAIAMSDLVIVPVPPGMFPLLGLRQLLKKISRIRKAHAPDVGVMALMTAFRETQTIDKAVREEVIGRFTEDGVFRTTIPRTVAVERATSTLRAVVEADDANPAAFAFHKLADEVKEVLNVEEDKRTAAPRRVTK